jgi:hypothetical protein
MPRIIVVALLLSGCFHHRPTAGMTAMEAVRTYQVMGVVPGCNLFQEGMDFPDGSVVDRVGRDIVIVIIPDPRSAEGEDDHEVPCR